METAPDVPADQFLAGAVTVPSGTGGGRLDAAVRRGQTYLAFDLPRPSDSQIF